MLQYYRETKCLHDYEKFSQTGAMPSSPNSKHLQPVLSTDDAHSKLCQSDYYKFRAGNLMFGFNAIIISSLKNFCEFNALRKNQLLRFYDDLRETLTGITSALEKTENQYRDYCTSLSLFFATMRNHVELYRNSLCSPLFVIIVLCPLDFIPQYEIGQQELIDVHHYFYLLDLFSMLDLDDDLSDRIKTVNEFLVDHIFFSTQKSSNYEKILSVKDFRKQKQNYKYFRNAFMTFDYMTRFIPLGFTVNNPKEKDVNSLNQTVFYAYDLMKAFMYRQSYEFEKECINQMARSHFKKYIRVMDGGQDARQKYRVAINIGLGYTYSKYNTLMHFLNIAESYWNNPDLSNIQVFGKDIRALLALSCQKIFFSENHCGFYHYGPLLQTSSSLYREDLDLAVATHIGTVVPSVSADKPSGINQLVLTDRVFEFQFLKNHLISIFNKANGVRFKTDNEVLNLCLLSLMLDFGLYQKHFGLLNIPFLQCLQHKADTRELQVEVANVIYEFDRKNTSNSITRKKVERLIFQASYKFLVNKDFDVNSPEFKIIRMLNSDPDYQSYVLLCKIYMSLCQINKSVEVDYYKVHCDGEFRIIIPENYSKSTSDYLEEVTRRYTFSEENNHMVYDDLPVFDLNPQQPQINLHKIRFDSATEVQSMVKYVEISNAFHILGSDNRYLLFMADNVLVVDAAKDDCVSMTINKSPLKLATVFFNEALSFIPCFKYTEKEDIVLLTSRNIHYLVDKGGQFHTDYYGMKHELIECISSEELYVDLNDEHVFKSFKLSDLLTESKTVIYFPDYLLQVTDRQQLINLLDLAIHIRNISFFILILYYLRRTSVQLTYHSDRGSNVKLISGPWKEAILYVMGKASNPHYDSIFERQFFDVDKYQDLSLDDFIEVLCENFTKYQRWTDDGEYEIVPRPKQKAFLKRIICSKTPMHFSEVGSGKTKVILPLLCQVFLSSNVAAHKYLARSGHQKGVLVILVPEHLVSDARSQVFRYCLNFKCKYRVHDDIFALMHPSVNLDGMKRIFVTSFNQFKRCLTYDEVCKKVYPHREKILIICDEVDDFLGKLLVKLNTNLNVISIHLCSLSNILLYFNYCLR